MSSSPIEVLELLRVTDLSKFQDAIVKHLLITKLEHFDHVKEADLRVD